MTDYSYVQVEAALIETNLAVMRGMRDSLLQLGIKKAHPYPSLAGVTDAFVHLPPDLVVVDIDMPDNEGIKIIRWLRSDPAFGNPFVAIIATTWQPTETLLSRFNSSGADALLIKPASPKQLMDRVAALVEGRKLFVVTVDYTGPDRRKNPREGIQIPTLEPPNSLRLKATGQWDRVAGRDQLAKGIAWLNNQKAERNAFQIAFLINYALPGLARTPPDQRAYDHVLRVTAMIEDLLNRVAGRALPLRFNTACKAVLTLVERIRRTPGTTPPAADVTQLQELSLAVLNMTTPNRQP
ncbi:MAG: response regulator, partial [Rhodospirillaceae bacterium]